MAYDFKESQLRTWPTAAQTALWRERALHEARRAAYWQHIAQTAQADNGKDNSHDDQK